MSWSWIEKWFDRRNTDVPKSCKSKSFSFDHMRARLCNYRIWLCFPLGTSDFHSALTDRLEILLNQPIMLMRSPNAQKMVGISLKREAPHIDAISFCHFSLYTLPFLLLFLMVIQTIPLDRFARTMTQTLRFCSRNSILGVPLLPNFS